MKFALNLQLEATDNSNFDKRIKDAHFVSFLFYYYCTHKFMWLSCGNFGDDFALRDRKEIWF